MKSEIETLVKEALTRHRGRIPGLEMDTILSFISIIHKFHEVPILMERYFSQMGISKAGFMLLIQLFLRDGGPIGMSEIGRAYFVRPATLTGIADTLEGDGLVERVRSKKDRRRVMLCLTPAGFDFMRTFLPAHFRNIETIMSGFTPDEAALLIRLMERFASGVQTLVSGKGLTLPSDKEGRKP